MKEIKKLFFESRKRKWKSEVEKTNSISRNTKRKEDTIESRGRAVIAKQIRTSKFLESKEVQLKGALQWLVLLV